MAVGDSVTVTQKVELYKVEVPPVVPVIIPPVVKYVFDLKVHQLPAMLYYPFQRSFTAQLLVINKGTVGADVTVKWWITDQNGIIYPGGEVTVYVNKGEEKYIDIEVLTPPKSGYFTLNAETTKPVVVSAKASFNVVSIPWYLIFLVLLLIAFVIYLLYLR